MGHDIIAGQFTHGDIETITAAIGGTRSYLPQDFSHRFDNCPPFVAHLRRSAFDPRGRVLYRALDSDNRYNGPSGDGGYTRFTQTQIKEALHLLPSVVADAMPPIDTTYAVALAEMLGTNAVAATHDEELLSITEEKEFLQTILRWMEENNHECITIFFG